MSSSTFLFSIGTFLPTELDDDLRTELEAEIFEQWLKEKAKALTIQLEMN